MRTSDELSARLSLVYDSAASQKNIDEETQSRRRRYSFEENEGSDPFFTTVNFLGQQTPIRQSNCSVNSPELALASINPNTDWVLAS